MAGIRGAKSLHLDQRKSEFGRYHRGAFGGDSGLLCGELAASDSYYLDGGICGVVAFRQANVFGGSVSSAVAICGVFGHLGFHDYDNKPGCYSDGAAFVSNWLCGESTRLGADGV